MNVAWSIVSETAGLARARPGTVPRPGVLHRTRAGAEASRPPAASARSAVDRRGHRLRAAGPRRCRLPDRHEVGDRRRQPLADPARPPSSSTGPRASRAPSRTATCCGATRSRCSRVRSSPPSRSAPTEVVVARQGAPSAASDRRLAAAIGEVDGRRVDRRGRRSRSCAGPDAYLFGEETALLEVRRGPPARSRGSPRRTAAASTPTTSRRGRGAPAVDLAGPGGDRRAAGAGRQRRDAGQRAGILAEGAEWFRAVGTAESPGTIVCTITGRTRPPRRRRGADGHAARRDHRVVGGGARPGRTLVGVDLRASPTRSCPAILRHPDDLRGHAARRQRPRRRPGSSCSTTQTDPSPWPTASPASWPSSRAASASRASATAWPSPAHLDATAALRRHRAGPGGHRRAAADGGHAAPAATWPTQQERVVAASRRCSPTGRRAHRRAAAERHRVELVAPIVDIVGGAGGARQRHRRKQPDWTYATGLGCLAGGGSAATTPVHVAGPDREAGPAVDARPRPATGWTTRRRACRLGVAASALHQRIAELAGTRPRPPTRQRRSARTCSARWSPNWPSTTTSTSGCCTRCCGGSPATTAKRSPMPPVSGSTRSCARLQDAHRRTGRSIDDDEQLTTLSKELRGAARRRRAPSRTAPASVTSTPMPEPISTTRSKKPDSPRRSMPDASLGLGSVSRLRGGRPAA